MKKMLLTFHLSAWHQPVYSNRWLNVLLLVVAGWWTSSIQGQTYCDGGLYSGGCYMEKFEIGYQKLSFGCGGGGDFTSQYINLYEESTTMFFIEIGDNFGAYYGIWIDFNDNGSFGDAGEFVSGNVRLYTARKSVGDITIPGGILKGNHRMRVRMDRAIQPNLSTSCAQYNGQTIDFTVTIYPSPPLIYEVRGTGGIFYGCTNTPITITGKYFTNAQFVIIHGVYTEIITKTDTEITTIIDNAGYYDGSYPYITVISEAGTSWEYQFPIGKSPTVNIEDTSPTMCVGTPLGGSFGGVARSAIWDDGGAGGTFANNEGGTPGTTIYSPAGIYSGTPVTLTLTTNITGCGSASASKKILFYQSLTWYVDVDEDGYGTGTGQAFCTSPGAGWSLKNGDCKDDNAAINPGVTEVCDGIDNNCDGTIDEGFADVTYYRDADGDGYGNPLISTIAKCVIPTGYSINNTDCDDANTANHPVPYYVDADHDGYGSTTVAMLCSSSAPVGYATNNTDCNDANGAIHTSLSYYIDSDGDGYGSAIIVMLCSSTAPVGYSTNKLDCNDADNTIHAPLLYYVDADQDGYGSTTRAMLCSSIAPVGYSTNNIDCNDTNAVIHSTVTYYRDLDADGYGASITITVCSTSPPSGYVVVSGDCNDNNAAVHPGALEICDGLDNNCNGSIDEVCVVNISISDVSAKEKKNGNVTMTFEVILSKGSTNTVTVQYTTQNSTATTPDDYVAKSGTINFSPGVKKVNIQITILGDKIPEPDETLKVILSNATNATITKPIGIGTIINDDGTIANLSSRSESTENSISIIESSVTIAPNPATSILKINLSGYNGIVTMQLINLQGSVIKQDRLKIGNLKYVQEQLNITSIESGSYFLIVTDEKGNRQTNRVVVAH